MPRWPDIATWRGPTPNTSGSITDHMYVVVHTADGTFEGTIAWQRNPDADVSSHFVVAKDGRIAQMLDTNSKAWTQKAGNPYSISIENEGYETTPLTPQQIEANARILAKAHQVHGIPLQLTGRVGTRGLGHHSMGAESGVDWGHSLCPGGIIKAQKPAILARAIQLVNGGSAASTGDDMDDYERQQLIQTAQRVKALLDNTDARVITGTANVYATENNALADTLASAGGALVIDDATRQALAVAAGEAIKEVLGSSLEARLTAWANSPEGKAALVAAANAAEDS